MITYEIGLRNGKEIFIKADALVWQEDELILHKFDEKHEMIVIAVFTQWLYWMKKEPIR